jgi:putative ABC transport system permease protein
MDTLRQDLRYAVRALLRSRGFVTVAVLCMALGIGVNTTIFSVINSVFLRPFPFTEPDRLVVLYEANLRRGDEVDRPSFQNIRDWQRLTTSFSAIGAASYRSLTFADGDEPERIPGSTVGWNFFPTLGVQPFLGRGFREEEDRPGAPGVVLLSHDLWTRRYAGDSTVIGRTVTVNAAPHTIVGVMPPGFRFPENEQAWVPLTPLEHASPRSDRGYIAIGRLAPGVTVAQARAELAAIARRLEEQYPADNMGWTARVTGLRDDLMPADVRMVTLTMMGAVTFVLLIACANVANLLLARMTARSRELAIRTALGAGRSRIVRQLLTESVLIALAGGGLGILFASWGVDLLDAAIPPDAAVPWYVDWSLDGTVLVYTLVISVLTGILFGLMPALQASSGRVHEGLKDGARGGSGASVVRNRLRGSLVVAEVALSLVLLVGASLFVRSFLNMQDATGGLDGRSVMTMRFYMPGEAYGSPGAKSRRVDDIVRRVEALPGVVAATASNAIPLSGGGAGGRVVVEGASVPRGEEPVIYYTGVTPHWFKTLGVSTVAGRDFIDREGADSSRVAIINQTMARRLWPSADPVGRRFRFMSDTTGHWLTVIGVVSDIQNRELGEREPPQSSAYLPYPYLEAPNTALIIRVAGGDPARITQAARAQIRAADPGLPVFEAMTMEEVQELGFWYYGLYSSMFGTFGGIALFLAAIGVYGVIAYNVTNRIQEIGVRVALGAHERDIFTLVVGQGLRLATAGVAIGVLGAFAIMRVIGSQLYDVSATDPLSFIGISLFLAVVAGLASYLPARRAARVDPMVALRRE